MLATRFRNSAESTLAAAVASGDDTISVASALSFPNGPRFVVRVSSELMLVTGIHGNIWSVVRGHESTMPASHASGSVVELVLSAEFVNSLAGVVDDQAANVFLSGPASGPASAPAFRALVFSDLLPGSGSVTSVGLALPGIFSVASSPVTSSGTLTGTFVNQSANKVFLGPTTGSAPPAFRSLEAGDLPGGIGVVMSVGLSLPSPFSVSGSPVTSSGSLAGTLDNQPANRVFAGPPSGSAAAPAFRALTAADLPAGTGSVTSVGLSLPAPFSVSGSPVTWSGTLTATLDDQPPNLVFAGPASGSGAPTFRALTATDLPTGSGTVSKLSVTTANGVSGTVGNPTTTPVIALSLGAITPASVAATGSVTGSNLSGANTGNQTFTLTGDVTGSGTSSIATTIAGGSVRYTNLPLMAASKLLGNPSASSANASQIALGSNLLFSGTTLNKTPRGATKAEQQAGTSTTVLVTPANQHSHRSAAKVWGYFGVSGGVVDLMAGCGVASVERLAAGAYRVNFATPFTTTAYAIICVPDNFTFRGNVLVNVGSRLTTSINIISTVANFTGMDDLTGCSFMVFGPQ